MHLQDNNRKKEEATEKEATVSTSSILPSKNSKIHLDQRRRTMLCFFRLFEKKKERHGTRRTKRSNAAPVSDITDGNIPAPPSPPPRPPDNEEESEELILSVNDETEPAPPLDTVEGLTPAQKVATDQLAKISAMRKERKDSRAEFRKIIENGNGESYRGNGELYHGN